MKVKIKNGEIQLKEFCSRKLKKEINKALYANVDLKAGEGGKSEIAGFKPEALDKANDVALLGMVEKITIDSKDIPISIEAFDEMSSLDVDKIIAEINKLTSPEIPNA